MKKKRYRPYLLLALFLLALFYLPFGVVRGMRSAAVAVSPPALKSRGKKSEGTEVLLLKRQNERLRHLLLSKERMERQLEKLKTLTAIDEARGNAFYKRRIARAEKLLNLELLSLDAKVIHRAPTHWNETLWINVGERDNKKLGEIVVAVGSPVLRGEHLIGVVEHVESRKSHVRLLTDSSLTLSVRVARGGTGDRELLREVKQLTRHLILRGEHQETLVALGKLQERLEAEVTDHYLAKGELYGSSSPLWRGRSEVLKGVGFNYDFGDEEGPALELRTGRPLDQLNKEETLPLIEVGDLLVTTGLDGVFPADIPVACVSKIAPLKEGGVSFEIEAELCAGNLNSLTEVTLLPPVVYDPI